MYCIHNFVSASNHGGGAAQAAKMLSKKYTYAFQVIEFAAYCSLRNKKNYKIFNKIILE